MTRRLAADPEIRVRLNGHGPSPQLVSDEKGSRPALRCAADQPWQLVQLGDEGRFILDCKAPLGAGARPDWTWAPDIAQSAQHAMETRSIDGSTLHSEAIDEIRAR